MGVRKQYEILEESDKRISLNKKTILFLSIGCPLISLFLLCTFNVLNFHYNFVNVDNKFLLKWSREFGSFVDDYYFRSIPNHLFWNVEESYFRINENLPNPPKPSPKVCSAVVENEKFDCFPRGKPTEEACFQRGCCYSETSRNVPYCYFPPGFRSYSFTTINRTENYVVAEMEENYQLPYPNVSSKLVLHALLAKDDFFIIGIFDVNHGTNLFGVLNSFRGKNFNFQTNKTLCDVVIDANSTGFQIIRKSTNTSLFDSRDIGGFIYSQQFIQISSKLPCKHIYGLGEGRTDMPLQTNWTVRTLWNHDTIPINNINGYGSYPMYMCHEGNGLAHVAAFLNPYSTDILLQPGAITYRTIGPPLLMAFSLGPSPLEAIKQFSLGMSLGSIMPPYWGLGFHLCRFGYKSLDELKNIWNKTRAAGIPYDAQWVDIDYMKNRNDFTLDPKFDNLGKFVNMLHEVGMHFVPILDPGVSGSEPKGTYPPYDRGIKMDIFVKDSSGKNPIVGKVWNPKTTVFPDFTHKQAIPYWIEMLKSFYKTVPFDGLWIDMNEPSNFVNGSLDGCPNNYLEKPPYLPAVDGGSLNYRTLCMSAQHFLGPHYMIHNVFGLFEAAVTSFSLAQIRGKRPFVITRASTLSTGNFAGHWTGDITSTWNDMAQSIKDIIHLSMYSVNLVGADICGFNGNTTASLCKRWQQLGAFYPFSRNHNSDDANDQDPVSLNIVDSTKKALLLRYSLLPYLYTLFWQAKNDGLPVIRPLFYLFPEDEASYTVNTQFMWGNGLLISPVLEEDITYVKVYLGKSFWYDIHSNEKIVSTSSEPYALAAPEDTIPILIRGGTILVMQVPNITTTLSRQNPFYLKVALNESNRAEGMLYWDDGETIDGDYSTIYFGVLNNTLQSCNDISSYKFDLYISRIEIFSLDNVQNVTINQKITPFNFNTSSKVLTLQNLHLPMQSNFNLTWFI